MAYIKNAINRFDRMMATITFAEAGERERALDILYDRPEHGKAQQIESPPYKTERNQGTPSGRKVKKEKSVR